MKDFAISITTCNRPEQMAMLLEQIEQYRNNYDITVNVYEDSAERKYEFSTYEYVSWHKTSRRFGKQLYWQLYDKILKDLKRVDARLYVFMPDDFILKRNFFDNVKDVWNSIPEKIAILPYMPISRHRSCWNNFYPVRKVKFGKHELMDVGYIDMNFVCDKMLLRQLEYRIDPISKTRWETDPTLSSGVGRQITYRVYGEMYLHIKGLQKQVKHRSVMNENADCSFPYL